MKTTADQIVATALDLLNEVGLDALTTRLLAQRLGVQQPALYWHFKNRRALLDAMNEAMMAPFNIPIIAGNTGDWQAYMLEVGNTFRAALLSHRDGARVHAGTRVKRTQFEAMIGTLTACGLPLEVALNLCIAVGRFTIGGVFEEQAETTIPVEPELEGLAGEAIRLYHESGETRAFEAGLRFLIAGAAAQLKPAP